MLEVQLYSLSDSLPLVSRHFYDSFKHTSPIFKARYILGRVWGKDTTTDLVDVKELYSRGLRYPICNQQILQCIQQLVDKISIARRKASVNVQLPTRLFRTLRAPPNGWTSEDEPLPFLRYLCDIPGINVDVDYIDGYALTRAVHAKFLPLVEFLLDHHASPKCHDRLAIKVAIRQKDLVMLKLLVERRRINDRRGKGKRCKLEDRVHLDAELLNIAIRVGATDIISYLLHEKGVVPDLETLRRL